MPYDILQGVKYDPRYDDKNFALAYQGLQEASKKYGDAESSIGDALAQYGSIPAVNPDRQFLAQRLDNFNKEIGEIVNKKYAGDYGAASKEITRRIKQEQPMFAAAKRRYDMDQKMSPLYTQLDSQKKLINKGGIDLRTVSTFDAQGNINMPTYNPIERPEYGDVVYNDIGKAIDQMVTEGKLKQAEVPWLMTNIQNRGLAAIDNPELKKRVEGYVTEFESKTPFTEDPLMQQQYKGNTQQFIEDTLRSRVSSGTQRGYQANFDYQQQVEEASRRARDAAKANKDLLDLQVMGLPAQDEIENTYLDETQSLTKTLNLSDLPGNRVNVKASKIRLNKIIAEEQKKFDDKDTDPKVKAVVIGPKLFNAKNDLAKLESIAPILEKNVELFKRKKGYSPKSDYELAEFIDNDAEATRREYTYTEPVLHPVTKKMLKSTISSLRGAKYRVGNEEIIGSSLADMADKLKVDEADLTKSLADDNTELRYNRTSGEYYINVSNSKGKSKKLYFSPDEVTATYSLGLKTLKNAVTTGAKEPVAFDTPSDPIAYVYDPTLAGSKSDKNTTNIRWINKETGAPVTNSKGQPIVSSIAQMEDHVAEINNTKLKNVYTKPYLPISQQSKVE